MKYDAIMDVLAPCGLNCQKCFANSRGEIKRHSTELQKRLGSFDTYAERFSNFLPVFKNYPSFKELLAHFTQGDCDGCRSGTCEYPNCGVFTCYKEKGVDFCFQCDEFPCDNTNFDPHLKRRWIQMNNRMKDIGVDAYFEETKDLPRYR
ncbi:MAG: DUF3795 domain-containing protein [Candidatus Korarchaeota archaeon]|nr:DUF3795 domain-containing protein [Candidatus Korarchaeota archaeon]NIU83494.1 DUF3795 domain-containing protein [Candidatus Thorarchaeota archaeon]NIW13761.1 DUF3795 domain-containing protein [Candidatus Thorarchaeota archaeon]NIW51860.1 DUF3795 domain-containing protein [Candidatus Korarchaeota archaeon]